MDDSDYIYEDEEAVVSPSRADKQKSRSRQSSVISTVHLMVESCEEKSDYSEENEASSAEEGIEEYQRRSLKRPAEEPAIYRPFKRQRSELNLGYLELLNRDIVDVSQRASFGELNDLPPSQIGLTYWSSLEKHRFFEAMAQFGKQNLENIATFIRSKSVVEISHYVNFLEEARQLRRQKEDRSILEPFEYPAAVEISQQCCHVQEEAADEISIRQEAREEQRERMRWGDIWDVTSKVAKKLGKDTQESSSDQRPPFSQLFHLKTWLELSDRIFMNSSIPGNNWRFIEADPPSVWATTFEDFHSLALSITRRLIQTTLFMAMSRIRSKKDGGTKIRDMVLMQDAEAAIASLGMMSKRNQMWVKSARRLRLDVYHEPPEFDDDHEEEPLSFDEVESELTSNLPQTSRPLEEPAIKAENQPLDSEEEDEDEFTTDNESETSRSPSPENEEQLRIREEVDEVFIHAAAGVRHDRAARRALILRVTSERQKERHADQYDEFQNYKAELEMWNTLQKKPPAELPKKHDPGKPRRSNLDVESIYPRGRDWMRGLQYRAEWEVAPKDEGDGNR